MSSHMYGFTCTVEWEGRSCFCQITYAGTDEENPSSLDLITELWDFCEPMALAQYELDHRDWVTKPYQDCRIGVWDISVSYLPTDPNDPLWSPPVPTEKQVLNAIATGKAYDIEYGWDT